MLIIIGNQDLLLVTPFSLENIWAGAWPLTNSFIHTEHLYSASSRELLRGAPDSSTAKPMLAGLFYNRCINPAGRVVKAVAAEVATEVTFEARVQDSICQLLQ